MSGTDERDDGPTASSVGLPPVLAPLVGAVIVGAAGLWHAWETGESMTSAWAAGSVLTGALIGVLVMLLDGGGAGTLVPRFLAGLVTALVVVAFVMSR